MVTAFSAQASVIGVAAIETYASIACVKASIPVAAVKENKGEPFGSFKKLTMDDAREIYRIAL